MLDPRVQSGRCDCAILAISAGAFLDRAHINIPGGKFRRWDLVSLVEAMAFDTQLKGFVCEALYM